MKCSGWNLPRRVCRKLAGLDERGMSSLVVIVGLIIVSTVGLAMLYKSNMESQTVANLVQQNQALYIAEAGLARGLSLIPDGTQNVVSATEFMDFKVPGWRADSCMMTSPTACMGLGYGARPANALVPDCIEPCDPDKNEVFLLRAEGIGFWCCGVMGNFSHWGILYAGQNSAVVTELASTMGFGTINSVNLDWRFSIDNDTPANQPDCGSGPLTVGYSVDGQPFASSAWQDLWWHNGMPPFCAIYFFGWCISGWDNPLGDNDQSWVQPGDGHSANPRIDLTGEENWTWALLGNLGVRLLPNIIGHNTMLFQGSGRDCNGLFTVDMAYYRVDAVWLSVNYNRSLDANAGAAWYTSGRNADGSRQTLSIPVGDGGEVVALAIYDEAEKVNLNTANPTLLTALLAQLNVGNGPKRTAIANWVVANAPLHSIEEILNCPDMTDDYFDAIEDYVTVYSWVNTDAVDAPVVIEDAGVGYINTSCRAPININTASAQVLKAVLLAVPGMNSARANTVVNAILANRPFSGMADFSAFLDTVSGNGISAAHRNSIRENADPSRNFWTGETVTTTEFCYNSNVFSVVSTGMTAHPAGVAGFTQTVKKVVRVDYAAGGNLLSQIPIRDPNACGAAPVNVSYYRVY